jgi:5-methylcytosine-specific restriction endonuclease McrA
VRANYTPDQRARRNAWYRARHAAHPEIAAAYRLRHQEKLRERALAYYYAHRAERSATHARYRAAKRDQIAQQKVAYRLTPEGSAKRAAYMASFDATHPRDRRADHRAWVKANRDRVTHYAARRRAFKFGNGGRHTLTEWREKLELFAGCCAYCGEAKPLERDHKTPLSRGGGDGIGNIAPACKSCNSAKGSRTAAEFITRRLGLR